MGGTISGYKLNKLRRFKRRSPLLINRFYSLPRSRLELNSILAWLSVISITTMLTRAITASVS